MKNFTTAFVATLTNRNAVAPSKDIVTAANNAKRYERALDSVMSSPAFAGVAEKILARVAIANRNENRDDFIAVKVLVKIVSTIAAIGQKNHALLDPYSNTILKNLIGLQKVNNKDCLVSLSRGYEYSEQDTISHLISRYSCSAGTASTQMSSTRMTLEALDICEIIKRKQQDVIAFKDNARSYELKRIYLSESDLPAVVVDKLESELNGVDVEASVAVEAKPDVATGESVKKAAKKDEKTVLTAEEKKAAAQAKRKATIARKKAEAEKAAQ